MLKTKAISTLDLKAGLVVFLIALPLSLGISIASGAPSSAGIISAIFGGLFGAYLGGSYVTINGPAAGLIVVVLTAIQNLGQGDALLGFKRTLACVVVVGFLQILTGLLKAGRFAALFPTSVVHGMLSAIGIIIVIKQIHVFLGVKVSGSIINALISIPNSIVHMHSGSALIGLIGILLLLIYPKIKSKLTSTVPAPLFVAVIGILLAKYIEPKSFVQIPLSLKEMVVTPSFDVIFSSNSLISIITIYFVASLESILSASAVDKLDPLKRESNFNRELWSKGVVNLACGLVGGLPVIAEIVRSSANISQGAKSPLANFSHSIYIFIFVALFPSVLNMIPLSVLASILILVGYRLSQPKQFVEMWHLGTGAFLGFTTTIVLTITEDLLIGVFAGILVKAIYSLYSGVTVRSFVVPDFDLKIDKDEAVLVFKDALTFASVLRQKEIMSQIDNYRKVRIDISHLKFIDHSSVSFLQKEVSRLQSLGKDIQLLSSTQFKHLFASTGDH